MKTINIRTNIMVLALSISAFFTPALSMQAYAKPSLKQQLAGKRIIMADAHCAGWQFNTQATHAFWRNERDCQMNDNEKTKWRIIWLDNDDLALVETQRIDDIRPPRTYLYKVVFMGEKTVKLKSYWTGWNSFDDEIQRFRIVK